MNAITLLDGGLGQEIYRKAGKPAHPLWSTKVMMETPHLVKEAHQEFIQAGARVITTNSYTATPTRLQRDGQAEWFEDLQQKAFAIADEARQELGYPAEQVQIAGCLSPLVGSYTADERTFSELKQEYQQIVAAQAPRVDLFLIETISVIREAQAAVEAAQDSSLPVLLSFTLSDEEAGKLRSGEPVADAVTALAGYNLSGLLFNCSYPESITEGLKHLPGLAIPYGGYANGFTSVEPLKPGGTVDALSARKDLDEQHYATEVMNWVEGGASIVGGCCEVGPSYIAKLREELESRGYSVSGLK
jgi:S-methylmethionine-dependent homocysteine/selenocysteine methylase